ncbi:hypothetical protein T492DRAFT_1027773 [Pavlovales sp. CCMP2436]|nr:hypothetical protein T492DRAFT_1027773 [Pavlovales sp. CCMP2436]
MPSRPKVRPALSSLLRAVPAALSAGSFGPLRVRARQGRRGEWSVVFCSRSACWPAWCCFLTWWWAASCCTGQPRWRPQGTLRSSSSGRLLAPTLRSAGGTGGWAHPRSQTSRRRCAGPTSHAARRTGVAARCSHSGGR